MVQGGMRWRRGGSAGRTGRPAHKLPAAEAPASRGQGKQQEEARGHAGARGRQSMRRAAGKKCRADACAGGATVQTGCAGRAGRTPRQLPAGEAALRWAACSCGGQSLGPARCRSCRGLAPLLQHGAAAAYHSSSSPSKVAWVMRRRGGGCPAIFLVRSMCSLPWFANSRLQQSEGREEGVRKESPE